MPLSCRPPRCSGFTLVELLVALFVFALLSAFAYRALMTLTATGSTSREHLEAFSAMQRTMLRLESDMRQAVGVTDATTESLGGGAALSLAVEEQQAKRVDYRLDQKKVLYRRSWGQEAPDENKGFVETPLLSSVEAFEVNYIDGAGNTLGAEDQDPPVAARVQLQISGESVIERIFHWGRQLAPEKFSTLMEPDSGQPDDEGEAPGNGVSQQNRQSDGG